MITKRYTVLAVEAMKPSLVQAARKLSQEHPELGVPELTLLTTQPEKYGKFEQQGVQVLRCDFTSRQITQRLSELRSPLRSVICRGDMYVQYLRQLVPHLPNDVPVSSAETLQISTNKRLMRRAFAEHCPEFTPKYLQLKSAEDCDSAATELSFPVIVKPASLASSLMIQQCHNPAELKKVARTSLKKLADVYVREGRTEKPELIVEEYVEGEFYSIDSYVLKPGQVWHTPLVWYVPAKQLGIDDFYLYKRLTPVALPDAEVRKAEQAAAAAIDAVGLRYSSAHIELVRTRNGDWKIIELGPRLGRFRNIMYREAYGIDHSYNDLLVRIGLTPELRPKNRPVYCAAYSIYPDRDGVLEEVTGLAQLPRHIKNIVYLSDKSRPGSRVRQAKNGGHALSEVIFADTSKNAFKDACGWFESNVRAELVPAAGKQPAVLGGLVEVAIQPLGIDNVMAKVDTGAFSGALHCSDIRETDGELFFTPLGKPELATSTRVYQKRRVRSATGHTVKRYLVPVRIQIHGKSYDTLIGLSERAKMKREMLIGRRFLLDHNIMVDVTLTQQLDYEAKVKS